MQFQYSFNLLIGNSGHAPVAAPSSSSRWFPSSADRVQVGGRGRLAKGVITHLSGVVKDHRGRPVPGVQVEIGQCDANGRYHHPRDRRNAPLDENFQGYGRSRTGADGEYRFRTIQPVAYPGRAPHIHVAIRGAGFEPLITQMYVQGAPENSGDWILNRVRDPARRASIVVPFEPHANLPEQRVARFDIVLV